MSGSHVIFGKYLRRPRSPGITGQDSLGNSCGSRISSMVLENITEMSAKTDGKELIGSTAFRLDASGGIGRPTSSPL